MFHYKLTLKIFIIISALFFTSASFATTMCDNKQILGRIEKVNLTDIPIILDAKLDTGADVSSLSATDIKIVKHNNTDFVSFTITDENHQKHTIIKPLIGYSHILQRSDEQANSSNIKKPIYSTRPEVQITLCVANQLSPIRVNLIDRSHFRYGLLIGAETLNQLHILVDVAQERLSQPKCEAST